MSFRLTVPGTPLVLVVSLYHPFPAFLHSCIPAFLHSRASSYVQPERTSSDYVIWRVWPWRRTGCQQRIERADHPRAAELLPFRGRANSIADGTDGDGIGRVDEMGRAGESEEVQCEPLYPGDIAGKISRRRDKGVIKAEKPGSRISRFYQESSASHHQFAVFKGFLSIW
ncbi:hypothetical protein FNBNMHLP_01647 [Aeromonas jandaei]